jgi:hypothetical protein
MTIHLFPAYLFSLQICWDLTKKRHVFTKKVSCWGRIEEWLAFTLYPLERLLVWNKQIFDHSIQHLCSFYLCFK